jgi:hypothetical protein
MKEPTASALAAASGLTLVSGTILGLPAEALLAGFGGGLVALSFGDPLTWSKKVSSVAVATIAAAYVAPPLVYVLPMPESMPMLVALKGVAFVIGAGAQKIIPAIIDRSKSIISGGKGEKPGDEKP